jgi:hypothetical protein
MINHNKSLIDIMTFVLGIINYPIDFPVMILEEIIRRFRPRWEWTPFTLTGWYLSLTIFVSYIIIFMDNLWWLSLGVYVMTAMEFQASWKCILIALGRPAIMYPKLVGLTKRKRTVGGRKLLTKESFYMGMVAYGFSVYYFAFIYSFIYKLWPLDSFHGITEMSGFRRLWAFIYYSTVTITTLGYGEIYPKSFFARLFVMFELAMGIFFVVFLFAIFVSYHLNHLQQQK